MKKFLAVLMSSLMLIGSSNVLAAPNTRYVLNKKEVSISADFLVQNGTIYLPAIDTFKACGYNVKATSNSITAMAIGKAGYVSIWPGKKTAVLNGETITLGTAPFFKNGVCYVSSKFIEEQTGVKISYVASAKTVYLDFKNAPKITSTVLNVADYAGTYEVATQAISSTGQIYNSTRNLVIKRRQSDGKYIAVFDCSHGHVRDTQSEYIGNGIFSKESNGDGGSFMIDDDTWGLTDGSDDVQVFIKNKTVYVTWNQSYNVSIDNKKDQLVSVNKTYTAKKISSGTDL